MSPVTGDGQLFIKPRLEPLIGQRCSGRRLIGGCWPLVSGYLCPEGKCQSKCVSTFHYQQTNDLQQPLSYVSTSHQAQGCKEKRELPRSNVQFKQFTLLITDGMILSQCGKCVQPIRCREWDPATNDKSDLIAWGEPRVSPCSAAQSGYSKLMINQDLENIKNMQLSTLSVVLVVEQDKKQNTVRSAHMIRNL